MLALTLLLAGTPARLDSMTTNQHSIVMHPTLSLLLEWILCTCGRFQSILFLLDGAPSFVRVDNEALEISHLDLALLQIEAPTNTL